MSAVICLVRHGEVEHHRDDVSLTARGRTQAEATGAAFAGRISDGETVFVHYSPVLRVQHTAELLHSGLSAALAANGRDGKVTLHPPAPDLALRNPGFFLRPDQPPEEPSRLYTQTTDPDMLRTLPPAQAEFYRSFWAAPDIMGFWLAHASGDGVETAAEVLERLGKRLREIFAEDTTAAARSHWLLVTHSGPMRALLRQALDADPGEPDFCSYIVVESAEEPGRATLSYRGRAVPLEL